MWCCTIVVLVRHALSLIESSIYVNERGRGDGVSSVRVITRTSFADDIFLRYA